METPKTTDPNPSSSNNDPSSAGDFECNICFELAQDPIVTLCGHLYCWPCIYRWLHHHSQSQECPVCKALINQQHLVPLYGRGKSTSDPRSRPIQNDDSTPIPNRPTGQRPQTAPPPPPQGPGLAPDQNYFSNLGFGFLGGFMPMATARFGNMTMSAGFGGLFPSLMSFQFNGGPMYGGYPYGMHHHPHGFHHHGHHQMPHQQQQQGQHHHHHSQDHLLKNLFLLVGFFVLLAFIWS